MSKEHFEPVTARTIAEIIVNNAYIGYTAGTNKRAVVDSAEDILAPHIRKPSDDDKSVPARCEEAYDEAVSLLKRIRDKTLEIGNAIEIDRFLKRPNPFKEADIVKDEVEQDCPEPNLPSDVEMFRKRLRNIQYFKETDSDYVHTGKINALFDDLISAVEFYKTQNAAEELKPEPRLLPFDLKAAQNGAKVVTHNGRTPVKIVADDISSEYSILATYTGLIGGVYFDQFDLSGRRKGIQDENMNLFILKEPETLEIQIWRDKNDRCYLLTTPNQSGYSKYYEADCELIKTITVTI